MSQADWETYVPRLVTAARVELGSTFAIHLQEALTTGVRPSEHDVPVASEENAVVWRLLTTSGHDGIPDSLMRRIPSHMKNGWLGIEACLWIRDQIIARGDAAAEVVAAWLQSPPILRSGQKHKMGAALVTLGLNRYLIR